MTDNPIEAIRNELFRRCFSGQHLHGWLPGGDHKAACMAKAITRRARTHTVLIGEKEERRFYGKTVIGNNIFEGSPCLVWTGWANKHGYAQMGLWRDGVQRHRLVHRIAYEFWIGPIPQGHQVDHRCHNVNSGCPGGDACMHRRCVNPLHLEATTPRENTVRQPRVLVQACPKQHPYDAENTRLDKRGRRICRTCERAANRAWHHRNRDKQLASMRARRARLKRS